MAMEEVLDSIRRIIRRWTLTTTLLTQDGLMGDTTLKVVSTRRFFPNDEILIRNIDEDVEMPLVIDQVIDKNTLTLKSPLQFDWLMSENASVIKLIHNNFVKSYHIGEPSVLSLNELPAITVNGTSRSSEWYTIRTTKEKYDIEIAVYVADGAQEEGYRFLLRTIDLIQKGLKNNVFPLVNDYVETSLLTDAAIGDSFIRLDTTLIPIQKCSAPVFLENSYDLQENSIVRILDATTLQLSNDMIYNFDKDETKVIFPKRLIFNSWPASINYGKIHKGTLLKAGVISYFAEETEHQFQNGLMDPQLK